MLLFSVELYLNRFREIVKTTEESVDALLKEERISVPSRLGNKTLGELVCNSVLKKFFYRNINLLYRKLEYQTVLLWLTLLVQ